MPVRLIATRAMSALTLANPPPISFSAPAASNARPALLETSPNVPLVTPTSTPPAERLASTFWPIITKSGPSTDTPTLAVKFTSATEPVTAPETNRYFPAEPLLLNVLLPTVIGVVLRSRKPVLAVPLPRLNSRPRLLPVRATPAIPSTNALLTTPLPSTQLWLALAVAVWTKARSRLSPDRLTPTPPAPMKPVVLVTLRDHTLALMVALSVVCSVLFASRPSVNSPFTCSPSARSRLP